MKKLNFFVFSCVIIASLLFIHHKSNSHTSDPDRYYHFAISRMMVESGSFYLKTVPQVDGLGWGEYFPDKEFLFHQFTALGYRVGKDKGVVYVAFACSILIFLVFFYFSSIYLPPWLAAATSMAFFTTPLLFFRLLLVRPHCLAVLLFLLLNIGLLLRKKHIALWGAALFVLSYHAFYLGLICIVFSAAAQILAYRGNPKEKYLPDVLQTEIWAVMAMAVGILVNPHFPSNLVGAWEISKIPGLMAGELSTAKFGMELYPAASNVFLTLFWVPLVCAILGLLFFGRIWGEKGSLLKIEAHWLFLFFCVGFFTFLTFQSPRAIEYAIPLGGMVAVLLIHQTRYWNRFNFGASVILVGGLLSFNLYTILTRLDTPALTWHEEAKELLAQIPKTDKPARLFNCEWDAAPSIMYLRPDIRFLDLLDPSLLYFANREAFKAKEALRQGSVGDVHGLIHKVFKADYVLCVEPGAIFQMETDPGFKRIFPTITKVREKGKATPILFQVLPQEIPQYANEFLVKGVEKIHRKEIWKNPPAPATANDKLIKLESTNFLNLSKELKPGSEKLDQDTALCAQIRPSPSEMKRLQGANFLVLGGGRSLQLYVNGKRTYTNLEAHSRAQNTQVVVPLGKPLASTDSIQIISCSLVGSNYWGVAVSAWTKKQLSDHCKGKVLAEGEPFQPSWNSLGSVSYTCLGAMAAETFMP